MMTVVFHLLPFQLVRLKIRGRHVFLRALLALCNIRAYVYRVASNHWRHIIGGKDPARYRQANGKRRAKTFSQFDGR
jgi:hypothetical protein